MVLSVINQYMDAAFEGMVAGIDDPRDVESYVNNAVTQAGVYDLVFTAVNDTAYAVAVYGVVLRYTSDASATAAEIRDGLQADAATHPSLALRASFVDSGNDLRITELDPETYGSANITESDANIAVTVVTAHSHLQTISAGRLVARGPGFQDLRELSTATDPLIGVTMHQHRPVSALVSSSRAGYPPNREIGVVKRGKVWMVAEEAVVLTDTPHFRYAINSSGSFNALGRVRNDTDSASCRSGAAFAKFMTAQATAGGLVLVQINLVP